MEQELQQLQVNIKELQELIGKLRFMNNELAYLLKLK